MMIRRGVPLLVLVGIVGTLAGLALAGSRGAARESAAPTLPIPGTQSSVARVVRSVHGYAYWRGPDLYPEVARQVDCLVTDRSVAARMVVSINRPDPLTIRFSYRPARGPVVSAPAAKRPRRVADMREFVAALVAVPGGDAPARYRKGPRERCWVVLGHTAPTKLPGRSSP